MFDALFSNVLFANPPEYSSHAEASLNAEFHRKSTPAEAEDPPLYSKLAGSHGHSTGWIYNNDAVRCTRRALVNDAVKCTRRAFVNEGIPPGLFKGSWVQTPPPLKTWWIKLLLNATGRRCGVITGGIKDVSLYQCTTMPRVGL